MITSDLSLEAKPKPSEEGEDKPKKPEEEDAKPESPADDSLMLTEIMVNPLPNSAEYIELYNPNGRAINLSDYQLAIGSAEHKLRKLSLRGMGQIEPKSYIVLTSKPQALLSSYPNCPKESVFEAKLPQMNNKSCFVFLYKTGQRVDGVHYEAKALPRGFQSKRGVAFQRSSLEPKALMTEGGVAYRDAGGGVRHASSA